MHRFDGTGNQAGLFTDGDPSAGVEASIPDQAIMNAMQEETVNVVGAGNLSKGNNRQLMTSIAILSASAAPNSVTAYNNDPIGTRRLFGDTIWQKSTAGANGWTAASYVIPTGGTSRVAANGVRTGNIHPEVIGATVLYDTGVMISSTSFQTIIFSSNYSVYFVDLSFSSFLRAVLPFVLPPSGTMDFTFPLFLDAANYGSWRSELSASGSITVENIKLLPAVGLLSSIRLDRIYGLNRLS